VLICVLSSCLIGANSAAQAAADPNISYRRFTELGAKDRLLEYTYLHGIMDGFLWANAKLSLDRHEGPIFCQPQKLDLTPEQELSILEEYVKAHPEDVDLSLGLVARLALEETFPCQAGG
jgi:hypothetical protein